MHANCVGQPIDKQCGDCLLETARGLQAIVDKLPKCWRLDDDGKLVQDVPMMHLDELFTTRPVEFSNGALLQGNDGAPLAFIVELSATSGAKIDWEHVYATREAAEAAEEAKQ